MSAGVAAPPLRSYDLAGCRRERGTGKYPPSGRRELDMRRGQQTMLPVSGCQSSPLAGAADAAAVTPCSRTAPHRVRPGAERGTRRHCCPGRPDRLSATGGNSRRGRWLWVREGSSHRPGHQFVVAPQSPDIGLSAGTVLLVGDDQAACVASSLQRLSGSGFPYFAGIAGPFRECEMH